MDTILVIGSSGQLGSVLTPKLQEKYGINNVIASDLRKDGSFEGRFEQLDATDFEGIKQLVVENKVDQIYHLAAILSASGEEFPLKTWDLNMKTLFNVLEVSRLFKVTKVFFPSSIAVFGDEISADSVPQFPPLIPATVYGISKLAGENWANYYHKRYGLDVRSVRYPGLISYQSLPGGGTTDYAVDIFHKAVDHTSFECFLKSDATLPMMYMDDAVRATIELMEAPVEDIKVRTSYNISGVSFSPAQLAEAIKKEIPNFQISYKPDFRQEIAESWPKSIEDSFATRDWNWKPKFGLELLVKTMIKALQAKNNNELVNS